MNACAAAIGGPQVPTPKTTPKTSPRTSPKTSPRGTILPCNNKLIYGKCKKPHCQFECKGTNQLPVKERVALAKKLGWIVKGDSKGKGKGKGKKGKGKGKGKHAAAPATEEMTDEQCAEWLEQTGEEWFAYGEPKYDDIADDDYCQYCQTDWNECECDCDEGYFDEVCAVATDDNPDDEEWDSGVMITHHTMTTNTTAMMIVRLWDRHAAGSPVWGQWMYTETQLCTVMMTIPMRNMNMTQKTKKMEIGGKTKTENGGTTRRMAVGGRTTQKNTTSFDYQWNPMKNKPVQVYRPMEVAVLIFLERNFK